jgi:hypothetical protein
MALERLKWARYGFPERKVTEVEKGELANFCPACLQPGINLPDDWTDDPARQVHLCCLLSVLIYLFRWVYKRIFVADGNFKADHVRHKKPAADVWLSPGGGMIPEVHEYMTFLCDAIERLTVSLFSSNQCWCWVPMPFPFIM